MRGKETKHRSKPVGIALVMLGAAMLVLGLAWLVSGYTEEAPTKSDASTEPPANSYEDNTPVQRYVRAQKEWRELDRIARDEKTPARVAADAAFLRLMEAQAAIDAEARK